MASQNIMKVADSVFTKDSTIKISAIVTFRNMEEYVKNYYYLLKSTLNNLNERYEIIFVDDASEDKTYEQLLQIVENNENVHLIKMRSSFGEASAFEAGFNMSKGS